MSATLQTIVREKVGSRDARKLRAQGRIPACIQGEGKANLEVAILTEEFLTARRHHEHLFDLTLGERGTETALVHELQWDPLGERILHVEFRRVERSRQTEAEVELEFLGRPKGGILNHLMTHVAVLALPADIPDKIEVRVDEMTLGHPLFARDLVLPQGVSLGIPGESQVALVVVPRGEEEAPAAEEGVTPAAPAAPAGGAGSED